MNEERCIKEKEIDRLTRAMFGGNGSEGVQVKLARIETKLGTVIETVGQIDAKMAEIIKAGEKEKGADEEKEKSKLNARQRTSIWITAIIGASGTIIALLTLILK
jgi:hypothetical protein